MPGSPRLRAGLRPRLLFCGSSNPGPRDSLCRPWKWVPQPATGVEADLCLVPLLASLFLGRWRGFRNMGLGAGRHLPPQPQ